MAFIDDTVLNDFQSTLPSNEKLIGNYGITDLAKDSTPFADYMPPSVVALLNSVSASRSAQIPVIKDQTVTVGTVPGFANIPINLGETANYFFTAFNVFSGFRITPAAFENNQLDAAFYRDNILKNVLQAMAVAKDDIIEAVLETRKTQVLGFGTQVSQGDGTFTFSEGTDTLTINKAGQKDTMFTYLQELMRANKLPGDYRIVTSPAGLIVGEVEAAKFRENQSKQLLWSQSAMPADRRYVTNQISPSSDVFKGFLVRDGDIGTISNFPFDFRNGTDLSTKKWGVTDVEMPFVRSRLNTFINTEATESTSLVSPNTDSNLIMTSFEELALWDRFYIIFRYNSDLTSRVNGIVKLVGATT